MKLPGFAGGSYTSLSSMACGARTVNLYSTLLPDDAKARKVLYPVPGLSTFSTLADYGRGLYAEEAAGRLFAVFGAQLFEIPSTGVAVPRGAVAIDLNPASLVTNGNGHLFLTSGTKGYTLVLATNAFSNPVNDVSMCGQLDSFILALDGVTGTLKISGAATALTWDGTQVVRRSASQDPWIALLVARKEIFLFGNKTGDVWYNAGNSPFPFAQRPGASFEVGIEAVYSLAAFGSSLAWLGRSARSGVKVYAMNGYTPVPISTEAVEWAIQQYRDAGTISDAIGWSYERLGHVFYVLEFPTARRTWVYDATTDEWHERGKWNTLANDYDPYRPRFFADQFGKALVCDGRSNKIFSFSEQVYADVDGSPLRRLRRLPPISQEHTRLFLDYVELECERGVGLTEGQGVDPLVMLNVSFNGGKSYGTERVRSMGKRGQYNQRVRWDRCGSGRDIVLEFSCTDPVPTYWLDAYAGLS